MHAASTTLSPQDATDASPILVVGSTGKTGRRVAQRLEARGHAVRHGSRSAAPGFDWQDRGTWGPALAGVSAAYVTYYPDLAAPGAAEDIEAFCDLAKASGVRRVVLLSGRGEAEAQRCEAIVQTSGLAWTVVRAGWFMQNFSEGLFRDMVMSGEFMLPAGTMVEPFIDVDDIADVAVAALTEAGHVGEVYEVTGPELLSFAEVAEQLSEATGRDVRYLPVTVERFMAESAARGVPEDLTGLLHYLFTEILDGRNAYVADGVERALGRPAREFKQYAEDAAAAGAWAREAVAS